MPNITLSNPADRLISSNSTFKLSDDGTNQTLTGDLGYLKLSVSGGFVKIGTLTASPAVDAILDGQSAGLTVINEGKGDKYSFCSLSDQDYPVSLYGSRRAGTGTQPLLYVDRLGTSAWNNVGPLAWFFHQNADNYSVRTAVGITTDDSSNTGGVLTVTGSFLSDNSSGTVNILNTSNRPALTAKDSTKICSGINSDLVDGFHHDQSLLTTSSPTFVAVSGTNIYGQTSVQSPLFSGTNVQGVTGSFSNILASTKVTSPVISGTAFQGTTGSFVNIYYNGSIIGDSYFQSTTISGTNIYAHTGVNSASVSGTNVYGHTGVISASVSGTNIYAHTGVISTSVSGTNVYGHTGLFSPSISGTNLYGQTSVQSPIVSGTNIQCNIGSISQIRSNFLYSTGSMVIDSSDDIIFDADGADVLFKDAGSTFLTATNAGTFCVLMGEGGLELRPSVDGTAALALSQNDGTNILTVDTTNKRVGIGLTAPSAVCDVLAATSAFRVYNSGVTNVATNNTATFYAPVHTVTMFISSTTDGTSNASCSGYTATQSSGCIRFNGADVAWGDICYYPNGGTSGLFRLSVTGSAIDTGADASIATGHHYCGADGTYDLGRSGVKWRVAYYDAADTTDPASWNDVNCLELLQDSNLWKDRPVASKYYRGRWTGTIQLDPNTCPLQMQDKELNRRIYQADFASKSDEEKARLTRLNSVPINPDSPNYDSESTGLLIDELVTFNTKCLRELMVVINSMKSEIETLKNEVELLKK